MRLASIDHLQLQRNSGGSNYTVNESIQALPASFGPPQPPPPPTPWTGDILKDASNLFAGWADKLTFGITSGIRQVFGYDDVIDYNSAAYHTGAAIGSLHNSLLMVTPGAAGGILGTVQKALNTAGQVGGAMSVIQAFQAGDLLAAVEGVVSIGLASVRGVMACQRASRVAQWGQRALHGVAAARAIDAAYGNFNRGDYLGAFVHLVDAGTNAYMMGCFAAGTPIRTPSGHKNIEDFEVGDEILSRSEYDPDGPIEVQRVEERFVRVAPIVELHVGGQVIRTTAEHPFWVKGKGWTAARLLEPGEHLVTCDSRSVAVGTVYDTGEVRTVFNVCVSNDHTYFVGDVGGPEFLWSHNAYTVTPNRKNGLAAEADILARLEGNSRVTVLGTHVRVRTPGDPHFRVTDILVRNNRTGNLFIVEVKAGGGIRTKSQIAKDSAIAAGGSKGAPTVFYGRNAGSLAERPTGPIPTFVAHVP